MEKPIEGIWIFDKITPRAGFVYSVNGAKMKTESSGGPTNEVSVNTANTASEVQLTTGLGVSKGIAAIDLAVILGSWNGVLTGPSVITGTLTLDFGKRGSSSSAVGSYESTPSPIFSNEESTPVTEEPASDDTETESDSSTDFDF